MTNEIYNPVVIDQTIPGGASQRFDGTWQDAYGNKLTDDQIAAVIAMNAQKAAAMAQAEAELVALNNNGQPFKGLRVGEVLQ